MSEPELPIERLQPDEIAAQAAALAAHLQRAGVHALPKPRSDAMDSLASRFAEPAVAQPQTGRANTAAPSASPSQSPSIRPTKRTAPVASVEAAQGPYPGPGLSHDQRQEQLDAIKLEVSVCTDCEILSGCRKNTVFGEGSASPRVAFFGEGPGADEDRSGRPFVGKAGQLLTKMIEACSFKREDVYILNTVKCRPPGNRNPEPDEIENCRDHYQRQFAILRPEYIVCLGAVSSQELLKSKLSVGRLRGRLHRYHDSKVLVTYHPAYLLRNPSAKKAAWEDLQLMLHDAGIEL